jgi:hypothetical protein
MPPVSVTFDLTLFSHRLFEGKTTILYKLKLGEIVTTIPTIGRTSFSEEN